MLWGSKESKEKDGLCDGATRRVTAAQIPKRGAIAGEGKPLSDPITSLGVCVDLGVSQQQCEKEIMWLQTEENEPG